VLRSKTLSQKEKMPCRMVTVWEAVCVGAGNNGNPMFCEIKTVLKIVYFKILFK
jgi:hypothetical protein